VQSSAIRRAYGNTILAILHRTGADADGGCGTADIGFASAVVVTGSPRDESVRCADLWPVKLRAVLFTPTRRPIVPWLQLYLTCFQPPSGLASGVCEVDSGAEC
jgi:hypothetical protein